MAFRLRPAGTLVCFFAPDGSGVAIFSEQSGGTHFVDVDPVGFSGLLCRKAFDLDDLRIALALDDEHAADQLSGRLVTLGIIDEIS